MPEDPAPAAASSALAVTACPLLAEHLAALHPRIRTASLTRIAGRGLLPDTDALLILNSADTLYLGTSFDDAGVWARAVALRAAQVLIVSGDDERVIRWLAARLGANA